MQEEVISIDRTMKAAKSNNGQEISNIIVPSYQYSGYTVHPFPVTIENNGDGEYLVAFEEAGISFSGATEAEAIREIKIEVIEVYELYKSEPLLGYWPKKQLAVLEQYIGKKK